MTKKELEKLSINELESMSYRLTAERLAIRKKALLVQRVLSDKIEASQVSKMLGREVQVIEPEAIGSAEDVLGDL